MIHACSCGRWLRTGSYERGIRRCRICRKAPKRRFSYWRVDELKRLAEMAHQPRQIIAAALGRTPGSITRAAARYGIKLTAPFSGRWPDSTVRRCRAMHADGVPLDDITARTGVPFFTLKNWLYDGYREAA
jgi:hypothetical protein